MSLWDRLKKLFARPEGSGQAVRPTGAGTTPAQSGASAGNPELEAKIKAAVIVRILARQTFSDRDVAEDLWRQGAYPRLEDVCALVEALYRSDVLTPMGYERIFRPAFGGNYTFRPAGSTGSAPPPTFQQPPIQTLQQPQRQAPPPVPSSRPIGFAPQPANRPFTEAPANNPYANSEILSLSAEALRKRALTIVPWRTAWIGRTDTIPPQSDERTAIIDRGLALRGLLTEEQLVEIHRVGDLWIKHHDTLKHAEIAAHRTADAAIEAERRKKAALRAQRKQEAAARRERQAAEVARRRAEDIVFLGPGVSGGLADRRANVEKLEKLGLPVLATPSDVAKALGITIPELRWLAYHSDAAERIHYLCFRVPKRSGGQRLLFAPHGKLARTQEWILESVLAKLPTEEPAHGFITGRSTVTNATSHVHRSVVVNLDLCDFFPTITFRRVRGVFAKIGYSRAVASIFALLCTEAPRQLMDFDGKRYWVAAGDRGLPQGACTSPALSNQVAKKLDRRLRGLATREGWSYTRYADDLTFSGSSEKRERVGWLMACVRHVVQDEGFAVNPKKGRVERAGGRQMVTGIVVNDKLSLAREEVRRLRAILHGAKTTGLDAQNRIGHPHFEAWLRGKIAYLSMVDRAKGSRMLSELHLLVGHRAAG